MPSTVDHLLAAVAADPSRPRLTWYDDATGERVELSGATLQTWVAKTTHLLDGELGVAAGSRVAVALPRHWTAAVWWLAVDAVGASLVVADPAVPVADPVDLVVVGPDLVADPGDAAEVVAVSLRPMGAPFVEPLPALVHDFAVAVRTQPDHYAFPRGRSTPAGESAAELARTWGLTPSDRVLVPGGPLDAWSPVTDLAAALAADASVVWVRNPGPRSDVERVVTERVTAVWDPSDEVGTALSRPGGPSGVRVLPRPSVSFSRRPRP